MTIELSLTPSGKLCKRSRYTYAMATHGLFHKRIEIMRAGNRDDDIVVIDRALRLMGYEGDIEGIMPAERVQHLFASGELRLCLMETLRNADKPLKSRELATITLQNKVCGPVHPKRIAATTLNVAKALKSDLDYGNVTTAKIDGWSLVWSLRAESIKWVYRK